MFQKFPSPLNLIFYFVFTDRECNPGFLGIIGATDITAQNKVAFDKESIIGLVIWMACVLYSSLRTASKSSRITMSDNVMAKENGAGKC